ncbi:YfiT family bacillithiol transferase [Aurantibacillus circumpalustris]|uniref:YfiT family bacillithiol transferase n=1 Tax=Aurantibacillus circumpalustris TaxID=3036359 RepID=UPI00295A9EB9|nr:putative metal-dependent hydrolase [Aurantibacillus circumpalustris]
MEDLKYPIGQYKVPEIFSTEILNPYIETIKKFPHNLKSAIQGMNVSQLNTPYRPEGWTVAQVVNHCADSHINALIRLKLALTENTPIIKPYQEALWAELAGGNDTSLQNAFQILEGVHAKLGIVLDSLTEEQWLRGYIHPEKNREVKLNEFAGSYAWHGEHHLAHITELKKKMGWV